MARRYIGEKVRYFTCANGWMFGTVHSVRVLDGLELATVFFPGYAGRYRPYPTQTQEVAAFLLERCS